MQVNLSNAKISSVDQTRTGGFPKGQQDIVSNLSTQIGELKEKEPNEYQLEQITEKMNEVMDVLDVKLKYQVHKDTNTIMVQVIEKDTQEVIREIPPKKILDMMASMIELVGLMFDEKV